MRRWLVVAASLVVALGSILLIPGTANAAGGTCDIEEQNPSPQFFGEYVISGYGATVDCTQPNVITITVVSYPTGTQTATSTTEDYVICQKKACAASVAWAVKPGKLPTCWVSYAYVTVGALDYAQLLRPGLTGLSCV
jgi:hypothetical protein